MLTISQAINQGVEFQKRGDLDRAEQLYRQVLEADARHADAWHLLGLIAHVRGDAATAVDHIGRAIKLDGRQPSFHNHLGEVFRTLSRLPEAEHCCRQALRLNDDFAVAHNTLGMVQNQQGRFAEAAASFRRAMEIDANFSLPIANLAVALHAQGRLDEALDACRQALTRGPRLTMAYHEMGRILREQGKVDEAIDVYRKALKVDPKSASGECYLGALLQTVSRTDEAIACYRRALAIAPKLADAHCNLGIALAGLGRAAEAESCYRQALQCNPRMVEAHYNLGLLLQGQNKASGAIECYQNAVRYKSDFAPAYNNLGMLYRMQGNLAGATDCYAKALEFWPNSAEVLNNLGNLLQTESRVAEAVVCYEQTLRLQPNNAQARCNLAMVHLADGDLAAGWPDYEFRRGCPEYKDRTFDRPQWQGEPLAGRRLLVYAEQGLGDTLQFVRYVPLLAERGAKVIFELPRPMIGFMEQSGIAKVAQLVARDDPLGEFDLYVPLLSLPGIFGTSLDRIPAPGGYLSTDPQLVDHWRNMLGDRPPLRVGIAWQGNPAFVMDHFRSIPLAQFAPLALDGVELVSLQRAFGCEQLAQVDFRVRELGAEFDEPFGAFAKTAAVMKNLDLVVTSDTATAHLAGGLGVPAWVALGTMPDWRWMHERADCPWYDSLRLFRQTKLGDWPVVFERMAEALGEFIRAR